MPDDLGEIEKRATQWFQPLGTAKLSKILAYVKVLREFNEKLVLTYELGLCEDANMTWGPPPTEKPKKFPQLPIGEAIIGHTSNPQFEKLVKYDRMEALQDRTIKIDWPYVLRMSDELKGNNMKSVAASADNNNGAKEPRITVGSRVKVLRNNTSALVEARQINGRTYARPAKYGDVVLVTSIVHYPNGQKGIKYAVGGGTNFLRWEDVEPAADWVSRSSDFANSLTRCFRGAVPPQCCHALLSARFLQVGSSHGSFQMKNLQKAGIGLLGVFAVALALFGTDTFSYLSTGLGKVQDTARNAVSIDFELARCKELVDSLTPEIKRNNLTIATEESEVTALNQQITGLEGRMQTAKSEMLTLKNDLNDSGSVHFVYSGKSYTRDQVAAELESRFERYVSNEQELASLQKTLEVRSKRLEGAKKLQTEYTAQQRQLNVTLETLKARLRMVEIAKTNNKCEFDSSKLGAAKKLAESLTRRLEVEERTAGANSDSLTNGVQLTSDSNAKPITDRVAEHFEPSTVTVADSK